MPSSAIDSSRTSFDTSPKAFLRSRKIVADRDLYTLLREVIGAAVYITATRASIVSTPLLQPRESGLIGWAGQSFHDVRKHPEVVRWDAALCETSNHHSIHVHCLYMFI